MDWPPYDLYCAHHRYALTAVKNKDEQHVNDNYNPCQNCGAHYEKIAGCNRILCIICKMHICHVCAKFFKNADECYDHLKAEHGNYW